MASKKTSTTPVEDVVVVATGPIKHDGESYQEGDVLPAMPVEQADALVALGAAKLA